MLCECNTNELRFSFWWSFTCQAVRCNQSEYPRKENIDGMANDRILHTFSVTSRCSFNISVMNPKVNISNFYSIDIHKPVLIWWAAILVNIKKVNHSATTDLIKNRTCETKVLSWCSIIRKALQCVCLKSRGAMRDLFNEMILFWMIYRRSYLFFSTSDNN